MIRLISFSFVAHEVPEATLVFDCRQLRNPHRDPELRPLDGRHGLVKAFVWEDPKFAFALNVIRQHGANGDAVIAFGCHGGQHRSVAMAEIVADYFREDGHEVVIEHMALAAR
jgi:UPF0042 nucleotide-binding protein